MLSSYPNYSYMLSAGGFMPSTDLSSRPFRLMASTNLNYYYLLDQWKFNLTGGYMYSNQYGDGSGASTYVGELRAGLKVSYMFGKVEPFIGAAYLYDIQQSKAEDPKEVEGKIGFNWYPKDNVIVNAEVSNSFFRANQQNTKFMLNLRYEF